MKLLMKLGRMRRLGGLGRLREVRQVGVRAARAEMWDEWDRWDKWECEPKPANAWSWVCGGDCGTGGAGESASRTGRDVGQVGVRAKASECMELGMWGRLWDRWDR